MAELLEREALLAQLHAFRADGGRLVFVGGEAGVGKTSLVRVFASEVDARVLHGACENLTTPTPLGPFVDVAAEVGGPLAERVGDSGEPRHVAIALLAELRGSPVLVLEDVHWADQATLDVLRVLGRRVDPTEALVLATYREDEVQDRHPLRLVLGELASASAVARVTVPPLSVAAVRRLADPHGADAEAIYRLTRGNAFFVTEVLAAGGSELPLTVRDAVLARSARLSPEARRLLDVVSLVPARTELWLLDVVGGPDPGRLDECIGSGVLVTDDDAVAFRHELARLALESAVAPQHRRALHAELLRALSSPPSGYPDAARLAHHAEQAGDVEAVLEYAPKAARRALATRAHREAVAQYARALRHADRLPPAERAALLSAHAQVAHVVGRYAESIESREEAIAIYRELGDRVAEGDNLSRLTLPSIAIGENEHAEAASGRSIELLEELPKTRELGLAYGTQSYMRMLARDNEESVAWARRPSAGEGRAPGPSCARGERPARSSSVDAREPRRADRPGARSASAGRGRDAERRGCRGARRVAPHCRPPRLVDPPQAPGEDARGGGRRGRSARPARRSVAGSPNMGSAADDVRRGASYRRTIDERSLMETYVILRRGGWRTAEDLQEAAARSTAEGEQMEDDVRWIRSYVLAEQDGSVGTVCIYQAASPEAIREHAKRAELPVDEIIAVADTVIVRPDPKAVAA